MKSMMEVVSSTKMRTPNTESNATVCGRRKRLLMRGLHIYISVSGSLCGLCFWVAMDNSRRVELHKGGLIGIS